MHIVSTIMQPPNHLAATTLDAAAWKAICSSSPSMWERLCLEGRTFAIRNGDGSMIPLSSFADEDLPPLPDGIRSFGRFLARNSVFANIAARRPGREEVTFYCLLGKAHGRGFSRLLDAFLHRVGSTPMNWRRQMVVSSIRAALFDVLRSRASQPFSFIDIGCGAGFDGLDITRILLEAQRRGFPIPMHRIINIDIDTDWLSLNERLSSALFSGADQDVILRRNISIFDYLRGGTVERDIAGVSNLIVSCNGFADFCDDASLDSLYGGISRIAAMIPGEATVILPIATRNRSQAFFSHQVGFRYLAREKEYILAKVAHHFPGMEISPTFAHSQVCCVISKRP